MDHSIFAFVYAFIFDGVTFKHRGNQRITLPVKLNNDIVEGNNRNDLEVKQFKTRDDLVALRKLARDRDMWKELSKIICSVA